MKLQVELCIGVMLIQLVWCEITREGNWSRKGQEELKSQLRIALNLNKAKNIIIFISDGMAVSATTSARIYKGQLTNTSGEEGLLSYEKFPQSGLSKVYCNDHIVPDSAATATAIMTGVKVNYYTSGVTPNVHRGECNKSMEVSNHLKTIMEYAQKEGKFTGIITNTRMTHATPTSTYAHTPDRDWECDTDVPASAKNCPDIASQFIRNNVSRNFKIAFAGGWKKFLPKKSGGSRTNETNLIEEWLKDKRSRNISCQYVNNTADLMKIPLNETDQILGLFSPDHLPYALENNTDSPSLAEMVKVGLTKLQQGEKGYVVMIESGLADRAFHANKAKKGITEVLELDKAVQVAINMTNETDTLIIVTSDHSQSLVLNGWFERGQDILGKASKNSALDKKPYTVLTFGNGPGFKTHIYDQNFTRWNLTDVDTTSDDFVQISAVDMTNKSARHSGEDVAIYGRGPWSHLLTGVHEENYLFHVMCYASCICGGGYACMNQTKT